MLGEVILMFYCFFIAFLCYLGLKRGHKKAIKGGYEDQWLKAAGLACPACGSTSIKHVPKTSMGYSSEGPIVMSSSEHVCLKCGCTW